jgi:hypothetical protein
MGVYKYKMTDQIIRNQGAIEAAIGKVLQEVTPSETVLELDYSEVTNMEISATTGLTANKLLKLGFQKVIFTGRKDKETIKENAVLKLLIDRGQLELK